MKLIEFCTKKLIKKLVTWYYKRTGFLAFSWGIDEHTDIRIHSAEYRNDGYRIGTREYSYSQR